MPPVGCIYCVMPFSNEEWNSGRVKMLVGARSVLYIHDACKRPMGEELLRQAREVRELIERD